MIQCQEVLDLFEKFPAYRYIWNDFFQERAAIMEHDGRMSRARADREAAKRADLFILREHEQTLPKQKEFSDLLGQPTNTEDF